MLARCGRECGVGLAHISTSPPLHSSTLQRYGDGQDAASAERVADAIALSKLQQDEDEEGGGGGGGVPKTTAAFATLVAACRIGGDYQRMHAAKLTFQVRGGGVF